MKIIKTIYFMLVITPLVLLLHVALRPLERELPIEQELAKELISDVFGGGGEP